MILHAVQVRFDSARSLCCVAVPVLAVAITVVTATYGHAAETESLLPVSRCSHVVALHGDDAASGTVEAPWGSLQHAVDVAVPGDVICIEPGVYARSGDLDLFTSGTPDSPVELVALGREVELANGLNIRPGTSHVRISGLRITTPNQWALALWGDNTDVVLSDLELSGGEVGIRLTVGEPGGDAVLGAVENVTVERSLVRAAGLAGIACTPGPCRGLTLRDLEVTGSGGVGIDVSGADVTIDRCVVSDNGGTGIVVRELSREGVGSPSEPSVRELAARDSVRIVDSHVERNRGVGVHVIGGGELVNTVVVDSARAAVAASDGPLTIVNSTLATCWQCRSLVEAASSSASLRLFNTILFNDSPTMSGRLLEVADGAGLELANNLLYNPFGEAEVACLGSRNCVSSNELARLVTEGDNLWADPRFFASSLGSFHLADGSPAINAGRPEVAPETDIEGLPRDQVSDIGAYEHHAGSCLLACSADAPRVVTVAQPFELEAQVRSAGCGDQPLLSWDLGSASAPAAGRVVRHSYSDSGQFEWLLEVTSGDRVCRTGGTIQAQKARVGPSSRRRT